MLKRVLLSEIWLDDVIMTFFFDSFLFYCIKTLWSETKESVHERTELSHCGTGPCNTSQGGNSTEHS